MILTGVVRLVGVECWCPEKFGIWIFYFGKIKSFHHKRHQNLPNMIIFVSDSLGSSWLLLSGHLEHFLQKSDFPLSEVILIVIYNYTQPKRTPNCQSIALGLSAGRVWEDGEKVHFMTVGSDDSNYSIICFIVCLFTAHITITNTNTHWKWKWVCALPHGDCVYHN